MTRDLLPSSLETERLTLRPITESDLGFFVELHASAEVMRYLSRGGQPHAPEATRAWLREARQRYEEERTGPFAIVRKEDGRLVGRSGMSYCEIESRPSTPEGIPLAAWGRGSFPADVEVEGYIEVGYVVHPDFQGQGYATEAAARWVRFALEERGEPEVLSLIHTANLPSLRVAAKNRLERSGTVRLDGEDFAVLRTPRRS